MTVIKRDQVQDSGTLVIEKKEHKQQLAPVPKPAFPAGPSTREQVEKAKGEAQKIIDQAVQEASHLKEIAKTEGLEQGKAEAAEQIEEAFATLNQAIKERKKIIKDSESELLRLSLKISEQIIRSEVSLHRDVCLNIVAEAIARVSDREQIIVRVNREDAEYLKRYKDRLAGLLDGVKSFSIIEDNNIEPGGCVIETNLGFIDSRIPTKIKAVEEALKKVQEKDEQEEAAPIDNTPSLEENAN